jgi:hypothetical protein
MEKETLMTIRPGTATEKLLWERLKNKTLNKQLEESELNRGVLQSELDELKYVMKNDPKGSVILKLNRCTINNAEKNKKIKKLRVENQDLICIIARHNLKVKNEAQSNQDDD